ncbi:MAG: YHS domain-containing protein [bacterium]
MGACQPQSQPQQKKYVGKVTKSQGSTTEGGGVMAHDPVCGMEVDEATAPASTEYKGQTYYFCSHNCKELFKEELEEFLEDPPKGYSH